MTEDAIMNQYELQIKILARMQEFGMIYILTAFAGHVPNAITSLYPNKPVATQPKWNKFPKQYRNVHLLDFNDTLFEKIGERFIQIQTKYYNTTHIYQCDTYNEMVPPTNDPNYLKSSSSAVYNAMAAADSGAVWLMQGWLFSNNPGFWTDPTIKAYLSGMSL